MNNSTCKTCVHWMQHTDIMGICASPKWRYTGRDSLDYDDEDYPEQAEDGVEYWDSEGWSATCQTGKYFGCIHYKPKEMK